MQSDQLAWSLLYPPGHAADSRERATADPTMISALAAETLFSMMRNNSRFKPNQIHPIVYFSSDTAVIQYRLDAIEDLLNNPSFCKFLEQLLPELEDMKELQTIDKGHNEDIVSQLTSISEIELYITLIERLYDQLCGENVSLQSSSLRLFSGEIKRIYEELSFQKLKTEYKAISSSIRDIKSITIGVNLDEKFRPYEAGIVSINTAKFQSGTIINKLLRMDFSNDGFNCIAPLEVVGKGLSHEQINGYRAAVNSALNMTIKSSLKSWQPIIRAFAVSRTKFLLRLVDEIRFLTGAVSLLNKLIEAGVPICKPELDAPDNRTFTVNGLYNPVLVLNQQSTFGDKAPHRVVLNHLQFDKDGMIYILTGPNQGGKTVFVQSVGIAQLMLQLGLFVPAFSAVISPVDDIFIHFPDDNDKKSIGRFADECQRLMTICSKLTKHSLLLMDETFSSTSASEATYIAEQLLLGLSAAGCRVLFATHLHDLARCIDQLNSRSERKDNRIDSLTAELEPSQTDGSRSYKISRSRPKGQSYARHIAEKYGLTYENLMTSLGKRKVENEEKAEA